MGFQKSTGPPTQSARSEDPVETWRMTLAKKKALYSVANRIAVGGRPETQETDKTGTWTMIWVQCFMFCYGHIADHVIYSISSPNKGRRRDSDEEPVAYHALPSEAVLWLQPVQNKNQIFGCRSTQVKDTYKNTKHNPDWLRCPSCLTSSTLATFWTWAAVTWYFFCLTAGAAQNEMVMEHTLSLRISLFFCSTSPQISFHGHHLVSIKPRWWKSRIHGSCQKGPIHRRCVHTWTCTLTQESIPWNTLEFLLNCHCWTRCYTPNDHDPT